MWSLFNSLRIGLISGCCACGNVFSHSLKTGNLSTSYGLSIFIHLGWPFSLILSRSPFRRLVSIEKGTLTYASNWHGWWFEKIMPFLVIVKLQIWKYITDNYDKIGKKEHLTFEISFDNIKHCSKVFYSFHMFLIIWTEGAQSESDWRSDGDGRSIPLGVGILFWLVWTGLEFTHSLAHWAQNLLFQGVKWSELEADCPHYSAWSFRHMAMSSSSLPIT